jgi:phage host-nuclease inhibitor protein Gam
MKTKCKIQTVPAVQSRKDLESLVARITALKLAEARQSARLDAELQRARDRHEPRLGVLREKLAANTDAARAWAEAHPDEFGARRSLEMSAGTLGWRAGQPMLKPLPGWTWDRVLAQLKSLAGLRDYVRVREEVNKLRLLADRLALGPDRLQEAGLHLTQADHFFVEPKLAVTRVEEREKLAA